MASRKPAQSKTKKAPAKAAAAKRTPKTTADIDRRWAILLFGLGLLFVVLALVPGESGWAWIRANILFGTFGISSWVLGPLMIWWAVLVSMEKPVFVPIIKSILFVFALSGVALVFGNVDFAGLGFGEVLAALMENGRSGAFGGGLVSLIFGGSLLALCGRLAARILLIIILLIAVMVFTGVTPADIARFFGRVGDKVAERMDREEYAYEDEPVEEAPQQLAMQPAARQGARAPQAAPPARAAAQPQRVAKAPARRMAVVDIPLSAEEAPAAGDKAAVDVDIGPETPQVAPGNGYAPPVNIGPGGTFGMKAVNEEFGLGSDYEPLVPFGGHSPAAVPAPDGQLPGDNAEGNILLFGEEDPYAHLGGADSLLPKGALLDVEYIPKDDPGFDLFGAAAPQKENAGDAFARAENFEIAPEAGQTAPAQPMAENPPAAADMPTAQGVVAAAQTAAEAAFAQPTPEAGQPGGEMGAAADTAQGAVPGAAGTGDVQALIDKAASVTNEVAKEDTRGGEVAYEPYCFPPADLFGKPPPEAAAGAREEMQRTADLLVSTLDSFGVETRILDVSRGPSVTRYEVQPQAGVKISRITNLSDDIALNLAAAGVRIEAPIPGKPAVGIEVPNRVKSTVSIRSILESDAFMSASSPLSIALGKDIAGEVVVADLTKMPHLLIAGSTGSGKSVCVNSIIMSFLYKSAPEDVKMILIDPKVVELAEYNGIPHLLIPVVTEPKMAAKALGQAVLQMEHRYHLFAEHNVRDINSFNKLAKRDGTIEKLPHIAIIIDELADLMMTAGKDVENYICRIAQKARAAGMHLIVATQRPSVDVITGLIKSNIPSRIAFAVSSQVDSRTILDGAGAEKLLGMGDMLFMPIGANKPVRVQGTYVKDAEISRVIRFVKENGAAQYDDGFLAEMDKVQLSGTAGNGGGADTEDAGDMLLDEVFQSAVDMALDAGEISTSGLQRRLRLGYARAGRIVDQMEQLGIVSEPNGSKPRQVLISRQQWQEMVMNASD